MPLASLVHEQPSCLIAPLKLPVPVTTLCENSLNDGAFSSGLRGRVAGLHNVRESAAREHKLLVSNLINRPFV